MSRVHVTKERAGWYTVAGWHLVKTDSYGGDGAVDWIATDNAATARRVADAYRHGQRISFAGSGGLGGVDFRNVFNTLRDAKCWATTTHRGESPPGQTIGDKRQVVVEEDFDGQEPILKWYLVTQVLVAIAEFEPGFQVLDYDWEDEEYHGPFATEAEADAERTITA